MVFLRQEANCKSENEEGRCYFLRLKCRVKVAKALSFINKCHTSYKIQKPLKPSSKFSVKTFTLEGGVLSFHFGQPQHTNHVPVPFQITFLMLLKMPNVYFGEGFDHLSDFSVKNL